MIPYIPANRRKAEGLERIKASFERGNKIVLKLVEICAYAVHFLANSSLHRGTLILQLLKNCYTLPCSKLLAL